MSSVNQFPFFSTPKNLEKSIGLNCGDCCNKTILEEIPKGFEVHTNLNPKRTWKKVVKKNVSQVKKKSTVPDLKKVKTPGLNATNKPVKIEPKKSKKKPLLTNSKPITKKTISKKRDAKKGLNCPNIVNKPGKQKIEPVPKITQHLDKNSLAYKMQNRPKNVEYFIIPDKDISRLLGKIEKKTKESVFISLTGGEGSMKTRQAFQFINTFAQNYKVGHASIEEHPESTLYFDKANQYLNNQALIDTEAPEIKSISDLDKLIKKNDVIVIDSFTKMKEFDKSFEVDRDLRKKYDGKLFIVIFQQTTDGSMRGGSKSQFDADVVLFTEKFDDYKQNYVYATKNRYSSETGLKFNIFQKQLQNPKISSEAGTAVQSKTKKLSFKVK